MDYKSKLKIWYVLFWSYYGPGLLDLNRTIKGRPQDVVSRLGHCSKSILLLSSSGLGWNVLLTGVVYLMIDTYNYFFIPMWRWNYWFIYYSIAQDFFLSIKFLFLEKQWSRGALRKMCSENMQQIYRRKPIPKCDFNKVALKLHFGEIVLSYKQSLALITSFMNKLNFYSRK